MKHLDLFSGIGGFALAARWVGWETVAFCEIELYCQKVLAKHWPGIPIYDDIKTITADTESNRRRQGWARGIIANGKNGSPKETVSVGPIDIITGGFPCQDISFAGKGVGIDGERSGLWTELARIIGEIRPRYAVMENVSALLSRGMERVAGDLAEIGYDCEWHCIPASAVGAPHRRDRIWIIAYPDKLHDDPCRYGTSEVRGQRSTQTKLSRSKIVADTICVRELQPEGSEQNQRGRSGNSNWWNAEPNVGRVAHGIPARVDRLRGLGNAIVPQVAEVIFRAINGS